MKRFTLKKRNEFDAFESIFVSIVAIDGNLICNLIRSSAYFHRNLVELNLQQIITANRILCGKIMIFFFSKVAY